MKTTLRARDALTNDLERHCRLRRRGMALGIVVAAALAGLPAARVDAAGGHAPAHAAAEEVVESASGFHGINLGDFSIRSYRAVAAQRIRVTFTLHATTANDDAKQFQALFESRRNKAREQVIVATRLVPIEDYDDPELKKLRRRILLRLRRTLPELPIADIFISDFRLSVESA